MKKHILFGLTVLILIVGSKSSAFWTFPGGGGSATTGNDFSGDANCVALWKFDNGAETTDSKGGNTLTDNNDVQQSEDCKEGDRSADFEGDASSDYYSIADGDLDSGFPLKSGETNRTFSICFWTKIDVAGDQFFFAKYDVNDGKRSLGISLNTDSKLIIFIGYNEGANYESSDPFGTAMSTGIWYHVGVTHDSTDKGYRMRIWDDNASQLLDSDTTGTFTNEINIEDPEVCIGSREAPGTPLTVDGHIDEMVVFKDELTTTEIDQIRQGTYGS